MNIRDNCVQPLDKGGTRISSLLEYSVSLLFQQAMFVRLFGYYHCYYYHYYYNPHNVIIIIIIIIIIIFLLASSYSGHYYLPPNIAGR